MPHALRLLTTCGKEYHLVPRIITDWLILVAWPQEIRITNVTVHNPDILLLGEQYIFTVGERIIFITNVPQLCLTSTEYNTKPNFMQYTSI
jgi:hypothetical protein